MIAILLLLSCTVLADICTLVQKVNGYRAELSLPPLTLDVRLVSVAQSHSEGMASKAIVKSVQLDENDLDEGMLQEVANQDSWFASLDKMIPDWTFLAENVAMGSNDENQILDLFKTTEEYNNNLLSKEATLIGIGEKEGYWTFEFAAVLSNDSVQPATC